jgi:hypothetical protein
VNSLGRFATEKAIVSWGSDVTIFDALTWECVLLRDNPIKAVYEKRGLLKRELYAKAHIFLAKYPMDFRGEDVDLEEFIFGHHDDKKDRKGILEYELQVPAIHYM